MTQPSGAQCPGASSIKSLQDAFLEVLPTVETHARIWFRHVACPGKREDLVAKAVALAWRSFLRLAERGKDASEFASAFAALAVRAVRSGRKLAGQERGKDAMNPLAQARAGFRVERLSCAAPDGRDALYADPQGQRRLDAYEERLGDNTRTPVAEQAAFRLDFQAWRGALPRR